MIKSKFLKRNALKAIPLAQYSVFWIWMLVATFFWEWPHNTFFVTAGEVFGTLIELLLHFWFFPFVFGVFFLSILIAAIASPLLLFNFAKNPQNADGILLVGSLVTGVYVFYFNPLTNPLTAELFGILMMGFYKIPEFFIWAGENIFIIAALYVTPILWKVFSAKFDKK